MSTILGFVVVGFLVLMTIVEIVCELASDRNSEKSQRPAGGVTGYLSYLSSFFLVAMRPLLRFFWVGSLLILPFVGMAATRYRWGIDGFHFMKYGYVTWMLLSGFLTLGAGWVPAVERAILQAEFCGAQRRLKSTISALVLFSVGVILLLVEW